MLKVHHFRNAQAGGIARCQDSEVFEIKHTVEKALHFIRAKDDRQFLRLLGKRQNLFRYPVLSRGTARRSAARKWRYGSSHTPASSRWPDRSDRSEYPPDRASLGTCRNVARKAAPAADTRVGYWAKNCGLASPRSCAGEVGHDKLLCLMDG